MKQKFTYKTNIKFTGVDLPTRTIQGVSLLSAGEVKGHGYSIDETFIDTYVTLAQKSLIATIDHGESIRDTVGVTRGVKRENITLADGTNVAIAIGDTQFQPGPIEDKILWYAEHAPELIGVSIEFESENWDGEGVPTMTFTDVTSYVVKPAANDRGLYVHQPGGKKIAFSAKKIDENEKNPHNMDMTPTALTPKQARELLKSCRATVSVGTAKPEILESAKKIITHFDDVAPLPAVSAATDDKPIVSTSLSADVLAAISSLWTQFLASLAPAPVEPAPAAAAAPANTPAPLSAADVTKIVTDSLAAFAQKQELSRASGKSTEFSGTGAHKAPGTEKATETEEDKRTIEEHKEFHKGIKDLVKRNAYYTKHLRGKLADTFRS